MEHIDQFALQLFQESVSLGVLVIVLYGMFRIANRLLSIIEIGIDRFLQDFERVADGIADIADIAKRG